MTDVLYLNTFNYDQYLNISYLAQYLFSILRNPPVCKEELNENTEFELDAIMKELNDLSKLLNGKYIDKSVATHVVNFMSENKIDPFMYVFVHALIFSFTDEALVEKYFKMFYETISKDQVEAIADMEQLNNDLNGDLNALPNGYFSKYFISFNRLIEKSINRYKNHRLNYYKYKKRIMKAYQIFLDKIRNSWDENKYITNKDFDFVTLSGSQYITDIFKYVHNHNKKIFTKLKKENEEFKKSNLNEISTLLLENNLNVNLKEETLLNLKNKEKAKKIIKTIADLNWHFLADAEDFDDILLNSTDEVIKIVKGLVSQNQIPLEFVKKNPQILTDKYLEFASNVTLINKNSIQITDYSIYLEEPQILEKRLNLVAHYNVNLRKNSNNNDQFLKQSTTFSYFDSFIEQGYYDFIRNHLPYCNKNCCNMIKRLIIANNLNLDTIDGKDFYKSVLTGNGFIVNDANLDNYIYNYVDSFINKDYQSVLNNCENLDLVNQIEILEPYNFSLYEYNFNGIIISKNKVLRCFKTLKDAFKEDDENQLLFNAIIYNSYLSCEDIYTIANCLNMDCKYLLIK